jgi:hypothetical protein
MTDEAQRRLWQQRFLKALHEQTGGNTQTQVSMYAVGEAIGLDRQNASLVAQDLMGEGQVAIKTLSGGIGITDAGAALVGGPALAADQTALPKDGSLALAHCRAIEAAVAGVKAIMETRGWAFDELAQAVADVRTIEAQLASPQPKSVVMRACLEGIAALLTGAPPSAAQSAIKRLLG